MGNYITDKDVRIVTAEIKLYEEMDFEDLNHSIEDLAFAKKLREENTKKKNQRTFKVVIILLALIAITQSCFTKLQEIAEGIQRTYALFPTSHLSKYEHTTDESIRFSILADIEINTVFEMFAYLSYIALGLIFLITIAQLGSDPRVNFAKRIKRQIKNLDRKFQKKFMVNGKGQQKHYGFHK